MLPLERAKRVVGVAAVNVVVLVGLVAFCELASSFFADKLASNVANAYRLNHTWKPLGRQVHDEWIKSNPDFPEPYVHVYNRQGWIEDYDIEPAKDPNTYRIFYVGDSFVEGTAPMDQSVPSIVETYLNDRASGKNMSFEVVNTGTSSYSPTIFYVLVRYVLMDYSPDLIVVVVDMTDDFDDWKYSETLIVDEHGNPWAVPERDPYSAAFVDTGERVVKADSWLRLQLFLARHSYTYNLLQRFVAPKENRAPPGAEDDDPGDEIYKRWSWCQREWDDLTRRNVASTLDLLERLAVFCHENGVKVMFTAVPHYRQYAGRPDGTGEPAWSRRPHDEIARVAKENGVPYLNSLDALAPLIVGTPQRKYYYHRDMHFNPRGYRIWAEAHIGFISERENDLLPEEFY